MTEQSAQQEIAAQHENPYIGPRSFKTNEKLFGRDYEIRELTNLLMAERIVLLHAPSGAGKSSLVQAGMVPRLSRENFIVPPVIRVNQPLPGPAKLPEGHTFNRYVYSTLLSLEECVGDGDCKAPADLVSLSICEYLKSYRPQVPCHPLPPGVTVDEKANLALIFDQFEEILTIDPNDLAGKVEFFTQLGEALRDRAIWALFAIREDYLPALTPYLRYVPTQLANTYRLNFLDLPSAIDAVVRPAERAQVTFEEDAASLLIDDLRTVQAQQTDGSFAAEKGPTVEPLQLQVVCYRLWGLAAGDGKVDTQDVKNLGGVDTSLSEYYNHSVGEIAGNTDIGVSERAIRAWFQNELITAGGIRGQVLYGAEKTGSLDTRAVRLLENAHLVRAEKRGNSTWYELSHDRLIRPVTDSNRAWFEKHLSLLQKQAALWDEQGRPEALLIDGTELAEAEKWAATHSAEKTPVEQAYLDECHRAIQHDQAEQELHEKDLLLKEQTVANRRQRRMLTILAILAALAVIFALVAGYQSIQASIQSRRAFDQSQLAASAEANAVSSAKTSEANSVLAGQQRDMAVAAGTQAAVANATALAANVQSTSSAALAAVKRTQVAEQAQVLNMYATQQVAAATRAAPTPAPTAIAMVDKNRSDQLVQDATNNIGFAGSVNPSDRVNLGLLLAAQAYQTGATFDSRSTLLTGVVAKLGLLGKSLGLTLLTGAPANAALAFNPDGSTLSANAGGQLNQWDVEASLKSGAPVTSPAAGAGSAPAAQPQPGGGAPGLLFYDSAGSLVELNNNPKPGLGISAGIPPVDGVTVSHWNKQIDWSQQKDLPFVFTLATEGASYVDPLFPDNWFGIKSAGILRGAYHIIRFDQDPVSQARHFLDVVSLEPGDLPPMLDVEPVNGSSLPPNYVDTIKKWLEYVKQQTKTTPILYFPPMNPDFQALLSDPFFEDYPLCVALIVPNPDPGRTFSGRQWIFWNYNLKGQIPGSSENFDVLRFNGSLAELRSLAYASALREAASGKILHVFPGRVNNLVVSPAGDVVAYQAGNDPYAIIDTIAFQDQPAPDAIKAPGTTVLAISSGGQVIFANTAQGTQVLINGSARTLGQALAQAAISADSQTAAGLTPDGQVFTYDLSDPKSLTFYRPPVNGLARLALSADGRLLALGTQEGRIFLWDLRNRELFGESLPGHTGAVSGLAFSPRADILASVGKDGQVLLWDLRSDSLKEKACTLAGRTFTDQEAYDYVAAGSQMACR